MRSGPHHLADGLAERPLGQLRRRFGGPGHRRELHHRVGVQLEGRAGGRNRDGIALVGERHRSGLQPAHDVGRESGRNDTTSVLDPDDLVGDLDRQIEVGARHAQRVSGAGEQETEQHRRRSATSSDGATGRGQHLDECVALGSELHRIVLSGGLDVHPFFQFGEGYMSRGKGNKGCGLWMTSDEPWSCGESLSPWVCALAHRLRDRSEQERITLGMSRYLSPACRGTSTGFARH